MKTAVEWQFEQLFNSFEKFNNRECTFNDYLKRNLEIREQSKEMEKEQRDILLNYIEESRDLCSKLRFPTEGELRELTNKADGILNQFKHQEQ